MGLCQGGTAAANNVAEILRIIEPHACRAWRRMVRHNSGHMHGRADEGLRGLTGELQSSGICDIDATS
jgi:hypothetical protein